MGQNDTSYEVEAGDKMAIDLKRFTPPKPHEDWEEYCLSFVQAMVDSAASASATKADEEDDDDYEEPAKPTARKSVGAKSRVAKPATRKPAIRRTVR